MKRLLPALLVVLGTACSAGSTTQYVGTVMNEAAPEKEGSLRLTLYSRTDTSFSGVIELGAPARGTGSVYAWPEGSELHIVSVGAESGDTIRWFSRLSDAGLGGRYEVVGGKHTGEQGTWRATLVAGLPATEATLRTPPATPVPATSAFFPVLLLIGLGVAAWRWIRAAPRVVGPEGIEARPPPSRLAGLGGWLAVFWVTRAITLLAWWVLFHGAWEAYGASMGIGAAVPGMQGMIVLETAMAFLLLPLSVVGLVLIWRRSAFAPRYWYVVLVLYGTYALADIAATAFLHPTLVRLVGPEAFAGTGHGTARERNLRQVLYALIWTLYWVNSRRVRATFGAAALDRAVTAPGSPGEAAAAVPAEPASPAPPKVRDGRRWKRIALGVAGAVVAAVVALYAWAFWAVGATPYTLPEGADIRKTVAGRWTWAHDSGGCGNAHTIAFAEDGKVMTITSGEPGEPDPVTTYDILQVTRSSIRGAIRGETRKTDDGKPVVWDLVLTGPDEYRWHRTDWSDSRWSYTGVIRRCPAAAER